jgi:glycosyltransferase involved in cell wall biosynthesis
VVAQTSVRLVYVARRYWPAIGGVESFMRDIARELATHHEITVLARRIDNGPSTRLSDSLAPPPTFEPFDDGPVHVQPLRIPNSRRVLLLPLLSQVVPGLRRYAYGRTRLAAAFLYGRTVGGVLAESLQGADAVHMWGGDMLAAAVIHAARLKGIPVAITPFAHRDQWGDDLASGVVYRNAHKVIGLLEADTDLYRELGVAQERLAVSGICSRGLQPGGGCAMRARYEVKGPLVLYLGVRRPYKGFDLLLEAAGHMPSARPGADVTFAFVGPGPKLWAPGAKCRILDVGAVSDEERAAWMDAADLLCLPSGGEIFPAAILEAWSLGKPVLTSDIPPLQELVDRSGGGMAVPRRPEALAKAISGLLSEPRRLHAMGEAGRAFWAARHTVDAVASWHERLYASLIALEVDLCAK